MILIISLKAPSSLFRNFLRKLSAFSCSKSGNLFDFGRNLFNSKIKIGEDVNNSFNLVRTSSSVKVVSFMRLENFSI